MLQVFACLAVAIGIALAIRVPLKKAPWVFYLICLAIDALVLFGPEYLGLSSRDNALWSVFYNVNRRAIPAFGFFTVVMFVGCFKNASRAKRWLLPVRAELSIMACLLSIPHIVFYLDSYQKIMFNGFMVPTEITYQAYYFSIFITVLLGILGVLSFRILRNHMPRKLWKGIQLLAYPFFVLIWVHVILVRLRPNPSALDTVLVSTAVYGLFVLVYLAARIVRHFLDRRAAQKKAALEASDSAQ